MYSCLIDRWTLFLDKQIFTHGMIHRDAAASTYYFTQKLYQVRYICKKAVDAAIDHVEPEKAKQLM